jgi:hypothetical protein
MSYLVPYSAAEPCSRTSAALRWRRRRWRLLRPMPTVAELRRLADRLDALPLDAVAEVLVLLEPMLDDLRRQAAFALERAPAAS